MGWIKAAWSALKGAGKPLAWFAGFSAKEATHSWKFSQLLIRPTAAAGGLFALKEALWAHFGSFKDNSNAWEHEAWPVFTNEGAKDEKGKIHSPKNSSNSYEYLMMPVGSEPDGTWKKVPGTDHVQVYLQDARTFGNKQEFKTEGGEQVKVDSGMTNDVFTKAVEAQFKRSTLKKEEWEKHGSPAKIAKRWTGDILSVAGIGTISDKPTSASEFDLSNLKKLAPVLAAGGLILGSLVIAGFSWLGFGLAAFGVAAVVAGPKLASGVKEALKDDKAPSATPGDKPKADNSPKPEPKQEPPTRPASPLLFSPGPTPQGTVSPSRGASPTNGFH